MPVKNAEPFLKECLDSILAQDLQNWELIAVDDGSEDNSHSILLEYSFKDERIYPMTNYGNGIIRALRLALENCSGNIITRMDADDIMVVEKLSTLYNSLHQKGIGNIAIGMVEYFSEKPLGEGYKIYETWLNSLTYHGLNYDEIYKECVIPSPCWMVYKEDLMKVRAFNSDLYPEDYDLAFRLYKHNIKPIACNYILHKWRDHSKRSSRNDENYSDNNFLDLKVHHFMELDRDPARPLVIWGAGKKGKNLAKLFIEREEDFFWVSNNPKKKGVNIYDRVIQEVVYIEALNKPQIIVNVSAPKDQNAIRAYLNACLLEPMEDYFFFC